MADDPAEAGPAASRRRLPGPSNRPARRAIRYRLAKAAAWAVVRVWVRLRVEGRERLADGPAVYCFTHRSWTDPFILMAALPARPRLYFFGPKEADMAVGGRNRVMRWSGTTVPYRPGKDDLIDATRRVQAVFDSGGALAIAGEGRVHHRESEVLPLNDGPAYFALRAGVPIVPIGLSGTSWIRLGGRVRLRIGAPIVPSGRPTREAVDDLTRQTWEALAELVADHPEVPRPGPFGRWLTEVFNDWPGGSRPA